MFQNLQYKVEIILNPSVAPVYMETQNILIPMANITTTQLYNAAYDTITNYGYIFIRFIGRYFE
jgi:hypothetical protein